MTASTPKKKTTSQLKKELDKIFSEYIRRKYADSDGWVRCYTCPKMAFWKEMQCGHFVSRKHLATRHLEANARVQCVGCNVFGDGRVSIYAEKLEKEKKGIVNWLYREANKITKDYPYLKLIQEYKDKLVNIDKA